MASCCVRIRYHVQSWIHSKTARTVALSWLLSQVTTCKCSRLKNRVFRLLYNLGLEWSCYQKLLKPTQATCHVQQSFSPTHKLAVTKTTGQHYHHPSESSGLLVPLYYVFKTSGSRRIGFKEEFLAILFMVTMRYACYCVAVHSCDHNCAIPLVQIIVLCFHYHISSLVVLILWTFNIKGHTAWCMITTFFIHVL